MKENKVIVLFEVVINKGKTSQYLDMAAALKDELSKVKGFISVERFSSLIVDGKLLSMSVWENEEAVKEWRNNIKHRGTQKIGRDNILDSYKITVVSSLREYTDRNREEAPEDSNEYFQI